MCTRQPTADSARVPSNRKLISARAPASRLLINVRVPANRQLISARVPANRQLIRLVHVYPPAHSWLVHVRRQPIIACAPASCRVPASNS